MENKYCSACNLEKPTSEFYTKKSVCKPCSNARSMETYRKRYRGTDKHKYYCKVMNIKRTLGVSVEEYRRLDEAQKQCAICEKEFDNSFDKQLDHCHITGNIREFLCHKCNKGLGHFNDNPETLNEAIKYLNKHKG